MGDSCRRFAACDDVGVDTSGFHPRRGAVVPSALAGCGCEVTGDGLRQTVRGFQCGSLASCWEFPVGGWIRQQAIFIVCCGFMIVMCSTTWAQGVPAVQPNQMSAAGLNLISRTQSQHAAFVLKRFRFNELSGSWQLRGTKQAFTEDTIADTRWEFHHAGNGLCARRIGEKEFRIFDSQQPAPFDARCFGTHPSSGGLRRFAYLRDSNAWISHRPSFRGEASTLLDRNVHAIAWTADGRHIVYCRVVENEYELVAYSLADDDYRVLLKFPQSKARPLLASDKNDGVYFVADGNTIRQISLPLTATVPRFGSLSSIPVLHQTVEATIEKVLDDLEGQIYVLETEAGGAEYETILSVKTMVND